MVVPPSGQVPRLGWGITSPLLAGPGLAGSVCQWDSVIVLTLQALRAQWGGIV